MDNIFGRGEREGERGGERRRGEGKGGWERRKERGEGRGEDLIPDMKKSLAKATAHQKNYPQPKDEKRLMHQKIAQPEKERRWMAFNKLKQRVIIIKTITITILLLIQLNAI